MSTAMRRALLRFRLWRSRLGDPPPLWERAAARKRGRPRTRFEATAEELAVADAAEIELDDESILHAFRGRHSHFDGLPAHCECPPSPRYWPIEQDVPRDPFRRAHRTNWRKWTFLQRKEREQPTSLPLFPPDWPERGICS